MSTLRNRVLPADKDLDKRFLTGVRRGNQWWSDQQRIEINRTRSINSLYILTRFHDNEGRNPQKSSQNIAQSAGTNRRRVEVSHHGGRIYSYEGGRYMGPDSYQRKTKKVIGYKRIQRIETSYSTMAHGDTEKGRNYKLIRKS